MFLYYDSCSTSILQRQTCDVANYGYKCMSLSYCFVHSYMPNVVATYIATGFIVYGTYMLSPTIHAYIIICNRVAICIIPATYVRGHGKRDL